MGHVLGEKSGISREIVPRILLRSICFLPPNGANAIIFIKPAKIPIGIIMHRAFNK